MPEGFDPVVIDVAGEAFVFFMPEGFLELHKVLVRFLETGFVDFEVFVFASSFGRFAVLQLGVFLLIIVIVVSFALFFKAFTALLFLFAGFGSVFGVAFIFIIVVIVIVGVVGVGAVIAGGTFGADIFLLDHLDDHA